MTTTYCTDADVVARHPGAAKLRWGAETDFDRVRVLVYEQINLALSRRTDPVIAPTDLSDVTQLKNCEVYGVLAELFAAAQSLGFNDFFASEQKRFASLFQTELAQPLSTVNGRRTFRSIRMVRG